MSGGVTAGAGRASVAGVVVDRARGVVARVAVHPVAAARGVTRARIRDRSVTRPFWYKHAMRLVAPLALSLASLLVLSGAACERRSPPPADGGSDAGPEDAGPPRVPDETPPVVTFLAPTEDCLEGDVTFRFEVHDADAGVAHVSATFAARTLTLLEEGDGRYSASFDVALLVTGPHALEVTATDAENNVTEAERVYGTAREGEHFTEGELACGEPPPVVVDETPPSVEILVPSPTVAAYARDTVAVTARVSDDVGPVGAEATLDTVQAPLVGGAPVGGAVTFSGELDVSGVAEGVYELAVTATDDAGNSASATREVTLDRTPPVVSILEPLPGEERVAFTDVVAEVSDDNGVAVVRLFEVGNDEALASTTTPSPDGRYGLIYRLPCEDLPRETTFEMRAIDRAGNVGSATVAVTVNETGCGSGP